MSGNISGSIYKVLMSQGRANGLAGTSGVREMGAGLPRGNKTDPLTAQAGENREPMGNSMAVAGSPKAPGYLPLFEAFKSPALVVNSRPVLRLIVGDSSRRRSASTAILRLVLT